MHNCEKYIILINFSFFFDYNESIFCFQRNWQEVGIVVFTVTILQLFLFMKLLLCTFRATTVKETLQKILSMNFKPISVQILTNNDTLLGAFPYSTIGTIHPFLCRFHLSVWGPSLSAACYSIVTVVLLTGHAFYTKKVVTGHVKWKPLVSHACAFRGMKYITTQYYMAA